MAGAKMLFMLATLIFSVTATVTGAASNGDTRHKPFPCTDTLDGKLPQETPTGFKFSGNVRTYYVAAEEIAWDYAPSGWDNWLGVPLNDSPRASSAGILKSSGSIGAGVSGTQWQKALYIGYTDASMTEKTAQQPTAGSQGPLLRGEVGDMIQVYFVNKLKANYASMHSMGLAYGKANEGSIYADTTNGSSASYQIQQAVPPGNCAVYKWLVPETSAPTQQELSKLWGYHSYVNYPADANAGLVGPIIVYARGMMNATMAGHREFTLLYNIYDESQSFLASTNYELNAKNKTMTPMPVTLNSPFKGNESIWGPQLANMPTISASTPQFPQYSTLNGWVYSNGPAFAMCQDDPVIWYVYAYGMASHVFHLHGDNFMVNGQYMAAKSIGVGEMATLTSTAALPGVWQVICHVQDHLSEGMLHNYQTFPKGSCPLTPLTKG